MKAHGDVEMSKYKLTDTGVLDQEAHRYIPQNEANVHWQDYLQWVAQGNVPDPEYTIDQVKSTKILEINSKRDDTRNALIVEYNGNIFDADPVSQNNLIGTVSAITAGLPVADPTVWRTADNINVNMSHTDLVALGGTLLTTIEQLYEKSWTLKGQVESATTIEEVELISWD